MNRTLTLFMLTVFVAMTTAFAQEASVKGKWDASIDTAQGPTPVTLTFSVEGDKVTGTLGSSRGDMVVTGTISGTDITFGGTFEVNGQSIPISFKGKVEGDSMSGQVDFGGMGGGGWSAKRAKPGRM